MSLCLDDMSHLVIDAFLRIFLPLILLLMKTEFK